MLYERDRAAAFELLRNSVSRKEQVIRRLFTKEPWLTPLGQQWRFGRHMRRAHTAMDYVAWPLPTGHHENLSNAGTQDGPGSGAGSVASNSGQPGAEPRSGTEGETYLISDQLGAWGVLVAWMDESWLDGLRPAPHLQALGELSELGFAYRKDSYCHGGGKWRCGGRKMDLEYTAVKRGGEWEKE